MIKMETILPAPQNLESISTRNSFNSSEYYNGAEYENYCWSQTLNEIGKLLDNHDLFFTNRFHVILRNSHTFAIQYNDCQTVESIN